MYVLLLKILGPIFFLAVAFQHAWFHKLERSIKVDELTARKMTQLKKAAFMGLIVWTVGIMIALLVYGRTDSLARHQIFSIGPMAWALGMLCFNYRRIQLVKSVDQ